MHYEVYMRSIPNTDPSRRAYLIHGEDGVWGFAAMIRVERMWCCTWGGSPWDKAIPGGMRLGWQARRGRVGGGSNAPSDG